MILIASSFSVIKKIAQDLEKNARNEGDYLKKSSSVACLTYD